MRVLKFIPRIEDSLDLPYDVWVLAFWNWDASVLNKPGTTTIQGLEENGCLMDDAGPAVILMNSTIGWTSNQNCTIGLD